MTNTASAIVANGGHAAPPDVWGNPSAPRDGPGDRATIAGTVVCETTASPARADGIADSGADADVLRASVTRAERYLKAVADDD